MMKYKKILYSLFYASTLASSLFGAENNERPHLSVSGTSLIKKEPDLAMIRIGVEEEDKNAEDALRKTAAKITAIMAALKANLNKENSTFSTDAISLSPFYEQADPKKPKPPAVIGFRASSTLTVKTEDLELVGKIIDLSSKAGANTIENLTYALKDDRMAKQEALGLATKNAINSANIIAEAAGVRLKRILHIQEESARPISYKATYLARGAMADSSFPVEPGEVEVSANVAITFEIE